MTDAPAVRLPYPHARNDCVMCREFDADFHVLGEQWNRPETGYRTLLCQGCLGKWMVSPLYFRRDRGPEPVTIAVQIPDERLAAFGLSRGT